MLTGNQKHLTAVDTAKSRHFLNLFKDFTALIEGIAKHGSSFFYNQY
jgi:hypothetical protein